MTTNLSPNQVSLQAIAQGVGGIRDLLAARLPAPEGEPCPECACGGRSERLLPNYECVECGRILSEPEDTPPAPEGGGEGCRHGYNLVSSCPTCHDAYGDEEHARAQSARNVRHSNALAAKDREIAALREEVAEDAPWRAQYENVKRQMESTNLVVERLRRERYNFKKLLEPEVCERRFNAVKTLTAKLLAAESRAERAEEDLANSRDNADELDRCWKDETARAERAEAALLGVALSDGSDGPCYCVPPVAGHSEPCRAARAALAGEVADA